MQFALDHSDRVDTLVIVDIAPKPYEPSQRAMLEALRSLDLPSYNSFGEADAALAEKIPDASLMKIAFTLPQPVSPS